MINGEEWFLMHDLNNFFKLKNKVAFFKLVETGGTREGRWELSAGKRTRNHYLHETTEQEKH